MFTSYFCQLGKSASQLAKLKLSGSKIRFFLPFKEKTRRCVFATNGMKVGENNKTEKREKYFKNQWNYRWPNRALPRLLDPGNDENGIFEYNVLFRLNFDIIQFIFCLFIHLLPPLFSPDKNIFSRFCRERQEKG